MNIKLANPSKGVGRKARFYSPDVMVKTFGRAEIEGTYRAAVDYLLVRPGVDADPLPVGFIKKPG